MPVVDVKCLGAPVSRPSTLRGDAALWLAGAVRHGEYDVQSLADVISAVERLPAGTQVGGLFLIDHGSVNNVWVGDEDIGGATLMTYPAYEGALRRLAPRMARDGMIHVMNCHAGQHETMLRCLARFTGVRVYGGTGMHHAFLGFNTGSYRMASPNGSIVTTGRPRTVGFGG